MFPAVHRPLRRSRVVLAAVAVSLGLVLAPLNGPAPAAAESAAAQQLPSSFQWSSTGPLIAPKPDAGHDIVSVKDPSVVRHNNQWLVFMTTADTSGDWSLAYTSFSDWPEADAAPQAHLETASAIGPGYRAAPHVFYFAPRDEWYLVYQTGLPSFSTTTDPTNPHSWTAPRNFQDSVPDIVQQNIGDGFWLDFWVVCDEAMCYLFSADDNGHLYRAQTTVDQFPDGFTNTQIVLSDSKFALFEGNAVYRIQGTNTYLLIMEAIGSDGRRWYRSFTADSLTGQWQPLAATEATPFARSNNVTFPDNPWSADISHGELIRTGNDQTMTIDPCQLQLLYQGMDPSAGGEYSQLPWRLALATHTNPTC
jgi:hypothetical protein